MKRVALLDYGSGNLRSAQRALERAGADVEITSDFDTAINADGLLVPGVGAFAACMAGLKAVRGDRIIGRRLAGVRPVLGICVGMQILFDRGMEHGVETDGCAEWPGSVTRLQAPVLPHMGWNTVDAPQDSVLFAGIDGDARFYFVHSYAVQQWEMDNDGPLVAPNLTWSDHGGRFLAAVENGPLSATQFHPEKSGDVGAQLLQNWIGGLPKVNAEGGRQPEFSFGKLVFYSLGAGVLVLAVMLPIIVLLARPYPIAALCTAIGAVLGMVVVIALVSRRMMSGVQQEIDRRRAELEAKREQS